VLLMLQPAPGEMPATVRLRRLLRSMLRGSGCRGLKGEEVPAEGTPHP
jgi:hypothetical protein